jgi:hypothetical protein
MGERDWKARYKESKREADDAAKGLEHGEEIKGWRYETTWIDGPEPPKEHLSGAAWVAWMYEIALDNARTLVQIYPAWQYTIDECEQLVQKYKAQEYDGNDSDVTQEPTEDDDPERDEYNDRI